MFKSENNRENKSYHEIREIAPEVKVLTKEAEVTETAAPAVVDVESLPIIPVNEPRSLAASIWARWIMRK